jgi:hypothetical protein
MLIAIFYGFGLSLQEVDLVVQKYGGCGKADPGFSTRKNQALLRGWDQNDWKIKSFLQSYFGQIFSKHTRGTK